MATWTYRAYDLVSGDFRAELDVGEYSATDRLNADGDFGGRILLGDDPDEIAAVREATTPGKTYLVSLRDGQPIFGGPIWRRLYRSEAHQVDFSGTGLMSHYRRFPIAHTLNFDDDDQITIARYLIFHVHTVYAGSDPGGLQLLGPETSGVIRDRTAYRPWERKPYGEALVQLAAVKNGFDWTMRPELIDGEIVRGYRVWYPRRGRTVAASGLRWRTGSQIIVLETPEDATRLAASVVAQGIGDGPAMLTGSAASTDLIEAGYPPYAATVAHKTVKSRRTLNAHAQRALAKLGRSDWDTFKVQFDPEFEDMPYGSWDLGDDVELAIEQDAWYGQGAVYLRRVMSHEWNVDAKGERLVVELQAKELA